MIAVGIAGLVLAALIAGAGVFAAGYGFHGLRSQGICSCGHPAGCVTLFGECTRQIRVRNYVSGARRGWKYVPCACRNHGTASSEAVTS
jgi:hypothetical protein